MGDITLGISGSAALVLIIGDAEFSIFCSLVVQKTFWSLKLRKQSRERTQSESLNTLAFYVKQKQVEDSFEVR
jgi:hypothetical protein